MKISARRRLAPSLTLLVLGAFLAWRAAARREPDPSKPTYGSVTLKSVSRRTHFKTLVAGGERDSSAA